MTTATSRSRPSWLVASRDRLERTVAPLDRVGTRWVGVVVAPILLTLLVITAGYVATGGTDPGFPPQFPTLVYGVASLLVLGVVALRFDDECWQAVTLAGRPTRTELLAAVGVTGLGVVVGWPATTLLADGLGVARYAPPTIDTRLGLLALAFGSVVVAPVVEEVLYRGLLVGVGLERGYSPAVVAVVSLVVFAVIHVFTAGVAGVVNAFLLGALLTWLRFRFDSLVGAWLFHAANNLLELLVAVSVVPSLYAL